MDLFTTFTSKVTSKGQVTLPVQVRKRLNAKSGDSIVFSMPNGNVTINKLPTIDQLFGSLNNPNIKSFTTSQIKKSIEKRMFSKNDIT